MVTRVRLRSSCQNACSTSAGVAMLPIRTRLALLAVRVTPTQPGRHVGRSSRPLRADSFNCLNTRPSAQH